MCAKSQTSGDCSGETCRDSCSSDNGASSSTVRLRARSSVSAIAVRSKPSTWASIISWVKVVVLGGGSTGEHFVGALRRHDSDAEVTLVESRLVGGECSYFACMPTKTMLRATELAASLDRAPGLAA